MGIRRALILLLGRAGIISRLNSLSLKLCGSSRMMLSVGRWLFVVLNYLIVTDCNACLLSG